MNLMRDLVNRSRWQAVGMEKAVQPFLLFKVSVYIRKVRFYLSIYIASRGLRGRKVNK